ncbi:SRPBCC family protein [Janthinobacterium agaricidamnosum]|uniref:Activator of Hsp90 ATPase homolog 1-like family protein n=1 Tax=Janthinobacterium agaricidamnosum NBRC 102515 = DSM 9628 TaxID=1349767 RepID=W0V666_9BURK|nr:SRPBCC domain-containing protein [Janthinobacterium agaricidamnosum]CDG83085.1 activator of Hsp90 ATPase homolog 1-like family protein [Janthinobacterium agaricidamnosum NBRC 102515 = DSM 9628]
MSTTTESSEEFVVTRILDAPRELVFKAWTEPERLERWWGPAGFVLSVLTLELEAGGVFHYGMRSADGHEMWGKFTYRDIAPPERIVSVLSFADREGHPVRHPMSPTWPLFTLNKLTLVEEDGKTVMTLRSVPLEASELERETFKQGHASMAIGFGATFGQLEAYLDTIRP